MSSSDEAQQPKRKGRMAERLAERRAAHLERGKLTRILIVIAGFIVTIGGLAMLVLPGPAFVVIPIGLALLALEFAWAEKLLENALERAEIAQAKVKETSRTQKILGAVAIALAVGSFVVLAILYDIPLVPVL